MIVRTRINGATVTVDNIGPSGTLLPRYSWSVRRDGASVIGSTESFYGAMERAVELAYSTDETGAPNLHGTYRGRVAS